MSKDYSEIGLNSKLRALDGIVSRDRLSAYDVDTQVEFSQGFIDYSRIRSSGRAYQAVIDPSPSGGAFTKIQDALDHVNSLGGGKILVNSGTYTIENNLTIYSNTSLEGVDASGCVLDFNSTTNNLSANTDATDITIRNMTFNNCHNTTHGAIYLDNTRRTEIKNCVFGTNDSGAAAGADIWAGTVGNNYVRDCQSVGAATFYYSDNNFFINEVSNNTINGAQSYSIEGGATQFGGGRTHYQNNLFIAPLLSAFFGEFNNSEMSGNILTDIFGTLSEVAVDINNTTALKFHDNDIDASISKQGAIDLDNCTLSNFTGNVLYGKKNSTPIFALGTSSFIGIANNQIATNTVNGTAIDGIQLINSDFNVMTGNNITAGDDGTSYGVDITSNDSTTNVIVGNKLFANTADINDGGLLTTAGNNA